MDKKILFTTSSFPTRENSSIGGGTFVLSLINKIGSYLEAFVVAPKFYNGLKKENIGDIKINRFGFLPNNFLYKKKRKHPLNELKDV